MSRLADLLDVSLSNATGLIDRMEERGLVERVRVPSDRRVVLVRASADGIKIRDEIEALKLDRMRSILARLGPDKLERILGAVGDLRTAVVARSGRPPRGARPPQLTTTADRHPTTRGRPAATDRATNWRKEPRWKRSPQRATGHPPSRRTPRSA